MKKEQIIKEIQTISNNLQGGSLNKLNDEMDLSPFESLGASYMLDFLRRSIAPSLNKLYAALR